MKQFLLTLAVYLLLMAGIHQWVLAIYTLPSTHEGGRGTFMSRRVVVNKLDQHADVKGEKVLFQKKGQLHVGTVTALPGDTVNITGKEYLIPDKCICMQMACRACRLTMVDVAGHELLIQQDSILGKVVFMQN